MEYNTKNAQVNEGIDFQIIVQYAVRILQKWWAILLSAVICASVGFVIAKVTYQPTYTCKMEIAVSNRADNASSAGQSSSDINASNMLAKNYLHLTTSADFMKIVAENTGYTVNGKPLTGDAVKRMIKSSHIEDTSFISISITSTNPDVSYAVATSYVNNFANFAKQTFSSTNISVTENPVKPDSANANNTTLLYSLLGFAFGAAIVMLAICIIIFVKDTAKVPDDITNKLNQKIIGSIVHLKKPTEGKSLLITDKKTGFMFIESFKLIRTKLENIAKRHDYKVFVFTSTMENEGKTTIATNTALALAKTGKSVLLIDADLRKPSVYKELGIAAANDLGLPGVVSGERTLSDSIKYFEKFNLFLLVTSQPIAESAELLSADEMSEVMDAVRNEFDYIIIDTPPAGLVADASIIAQYADANVMVVRRDRASMRRIRRTIDDMTGTGKEVVGCIYNDAENGSVLSFMKSNKKGKKGYGYGYGYGYSYGDNYKKTPAKQENGQSQNMTVIASEGE